MKDIIQIPMDFDRMDEMIYQMYCVLLLCCLFVHFVVLYPLIMTGLHPKRKKGLWSARRDQSRLYKSQHKKHDCGFLQG